MAGKNILITDQTGYVAEPIKDALVHKGYNVSIASVQPLANNISQLLNEAKTQNANLVIVSHPGVFTDIGKTNSINIVKQLKAAGIPVLVIDTPQTGTPDYALIREAGAKCLGLDAGNDTVIAAVASLLAEKDKLDRNIK